LHALVLDEADQMLDMGFVNDVKKNRKLTPKNRQTLFSLQQCQLRFGNWLKCFNKSETVTVSPVSSTAENVEQHVYFVEKNRKRNLLYHLIKNQDLSDVLVFSRTKHDNVVKALRKTGLQLRPYMVINLRMQDSVLEALRIKKLAFS
jgi:ATP-dependent RNA helicase RhlE